MTDDLIKRAEKALEEYESKYGKSGDLVSATFCFGVEARTLLPEAIKEIKRLRGALDAAREAHDAILEDAYKLEAHAQAAEARCISLEGMELQALRQRDAAEAKLAVAVDALEDALNRMEEDRAALAEIKGEK